MGISETKKEKRKMLRAASDEKQIKQERKRNMATSRSVVRFSVRHDIPVPHSVQTFSLLLLLRRR